MSAICESLGCTTAQALLEDPQVILPVLEYRLAVSARAQLNADASKLTEGQAAILVEIDKVLRELYG